MPSPLPPPPSCWGENRAKFSDVVARSPEIVSPFSNLNHKSQTNTSNLSTVFNTDVKNVQYAKPLFNTDVKDIQYAKPQSTQESAQTPKEYSLMSSPAPLCNTTVNKNKSLEPEALILQPESQPSNSYFINTFTEHSVSYCSN